MTEVRRVQTQLTEEQVRDLRKLLVGPAMPRPRIPDETILALADAYLAQQRVIEAARQVQVLHHPEHDTTDSFADFTRRCEPDCPGCALDSALASVGSPETSRP